MGPEPNKYYSDYEDAFPDQHKIEKEFFEILDEIEEKFGASISQSNFSKSAQFFQLFNLVMRLKRAKIDISTATAKKILLLGEKIRGREELPERVELALAARFNRKSNQTTVADFFFENATR